MNKELKIIIEQVSLEKGLDKEKVLGAIQSALESIYRKKHKHLYNVRVEINPETGEHQCYKRVLIVDEDEFVNEEGENQIDVFQHIYLKDVGPEHQDLKVGDYIETELEHFKFSRIFAQQARQVIMQKLREEEKLKVVETYQNREGTIIQAEVTRTEKDKVYLDVGDNVEMVIYRSHLIPVERLRIKERIRVYLKEVKLDFRGPCLIGSRTDPELLSKLFEIEVPEINQGLVSIVAAARDPGVRAKLAVRSNEPKLEPVGACVGMRGQRVQSVSNELSGERVDIILYDENPAQYVINAMAPTEAKNIVIDEEKNTVLMSVATEKLPQAIGRNGQNVKLASQLTGWTIKVVDEKEQKEKEALEDERLIEIFKTDLQVSDEVAKILVEGDVHSIEDIAFKEDYLNGIDDLDDDLKKELISRANDFLLKKALEADVLTGDSLVQELNKIDADKLELLNRNGIHSITDLADLAIDELLDMCTSYNRERASSLIMEARKIAYQIEQ